MDRGTVSQGRGTGARLPGFENELQHVLCGLELCPHSSGLYHVAKDGAYLSSLLRCWETYAADMEVLRQGGAQ